MGDWQFIDSGDGVSVPLWVFPPEGAAKAVMLMLPALGVQARFYQRLAIGLAAAGIAVCLFEQRGHGKSPYRAGRGQTFGLKEFLGDDIPVAIGHAKGLFPGVPFYLGGHSLGGHLAAIAAGRGYDIAGVVQLACGFPYHGFYDARQAKQIKTLCRLLPLVTLLFGYYPGDRFGFGGREYRRLMLDWRDWALGGGYDCPAMPDAEAEIAAYQGRVLSLSFEKDRLASDEAIAYSRSCFTGADVTALILGEAAQGAHLGHFDWARKPTGTVQAIVNWMTE